MLAEVTEPAFVVGHLRGENSWDPITIVCPAAARNDIITNLVEEGPVVGVTVQTPSMFLRSQHKKLSPRTYLDRGEIMRRVATILAGGTTPFTESGAADQPETLLSLTNIVQRLLALPPENLEKHGGKKLPQTVAEIATKIREETRGEYFTDFEVRLLAEQEVRAGKVISAGLLFKDPGLAKVFESGKKLEVFITDGGYWDFDKQFGRYISFVDEEEELLAVARKIRTLVAYHEVPLHRIAVGCADPDYIPLATRILSEGGIPVSSPEGRTLADHALAKGFLKLVCLDPAIMPRREIAAAIETGALKDAPYLPVFDRVTRSNGGLFNMQDWGEVSGFVEDNETIDPHEKETRRWVLDLEKDLAHVWSQKSWAALSDALVTLAKQRLQPNAADAGIQMLLLNCLEELRKMDSVDSFKPTQALVCQLIQESLSDTSLSTPDGLVVIGGLDSLYGRDLEAAFIVGISSEVFPGTFHPDAAVTPEQSGLSSEYYSQYMEELWSEHFDCAEAKYYSYARTSLVRPKKRECTPWLSHCPWKESGEFCDGFMGFSPFADPVSQQRLEIEMATSGTSDESRYSRVARSRREANFDEFNGNITSSIGQQYFDRVLSASALESYSRSPLIFFIERLLGSRVLEDQDEVLRVDAADLGTTYHAIFEKWTRRVWLQPDSPTNAGDVDWNEAEQILREIVEEESAFLNSGRYSEATRATQKAEIEEIVSMWFEQQQADAQQGWIPVGAETQFGFGDRPPLEVTLPDGNVVKFRGSIDRIDINVNGPEKIIRVTDFKSGSSTKYEPKKDDVSPYGGYRDGSLTLHLQLGLYGEAVHQALLGRVKEMSPIFEKWGVDQNAEIRARYSFFRDQDSAGEKEVTLTVTEDAIKAFVDVVHNIRNLIVDGVFPPHSINTMWKDEAKFRLGEESYDHLVAGLKNKGVVPVPVLGSSKEEAENE